MQDVVNDNAAYMQYGTDTAEKPGCAENTIYYVMKNSRTISVEQDFFMKAMLMHNSGKKLKEVGFKRVPTASAVDPTAAAAADKVELVAAKAQLEFKPNIVEPVFDVEQVNNLNQAETGPF